MLNQDVSILGAPGDPCPMSCKLGEKAVLNVDNVCVCVPAPMVPDLAAWKIAVGVAGAAALVGGVVLFSSRRRRRRR